MRRIARREGLEPNACRASTRGGRGNGARSARGHMGRLAGHVGHVGVAGRRSAHAATVPRRARPVVVEDESALESGGSDLLTLSFSPNRLILFRNASWPRISGAFSATRPAACCCAERRFSIPGLMPPTFESLLENQFADNIAFSYDRRSSTVSLSKFAAGAEELDAMFDSMFAGPSADGSPEPASGTEFDSEVADLESLVSDSFASEVAERVVEKMVRCRARRQPCHVVGQAIRRSRLAEPSLQLAYLDAPHLCRPRKLLRRRTISRRWSFRRPMGPCPFPSPPCQVHPWPCPCL